MIAPARASQWGRYLFDFVGRGDLASLVDAARWMLLRRAARRSRIIQTDLGRFHCRAGTTDYLHVSPVYEHEVRRLLSSEVRASTAFLDIGACLGETSIALARQGARCFAFEPDPDNFGNLLENRRLNGLSDHIQVHRLALGSSAGEMAFYSDPVNRGASGRAPMKEATHVVKVETLDALAPSLGLDAFDHLCIKIDAEGMEVEVLEGARQVLASHRSITLIAEAKHIDRGRLDELLLSTGFAPPEHIDAHNVCAFKR